MPAVFVTSENFTAMGGVDIVAMDVVEVEEAGGREQPPRQTIRRGITGPDKREVRTVTVCLLESLCGEALCFFAPAFALAAALPL